MNVRSDLIKEADSGKRENRSPSLRKMQRKSSLSLCKPLFQEPKVPANICTDSNSNAIAALSHCSGSFPL